LQYKIVGLAYTRGLYKLKYTGYTVTVVRKVVISLLNALSLPEIPHYYTYLTGAFKP
jgi:hypothetical protein